METALRPGQTVYTSNGDKLGEVKEVRGDHFKVDAPMKPDYWLSCDCVSGGMATEDRVTVAFDKDRLDEYKVDLN